MVNFEGKEMEKFQRGGLEVKPGTQRKAPMQVGAVLLLKRFGRCDPEFVSQVISVEDRGADYMPRPVPPLTLLVHATPFLFRARTPNTAL